jgi:hypothetical protein
MFEPKVDYILLDEFMQVFPHFELITMCAKDVDAILFMAEFDVEQL